MGEQFGVSRTPIRKALQQLMHEGLLEGRPNTGVKVAVARPADAICDFIVIIRRMVEIFALRIFFNQLTESDFAHWQSILERMRQACVEEDYTAIAKHDIDFHRSIVRRAAAARPGIDLDVARWASTLPFRKRNARIIRMQWRFMKNTWESWKHSRAATSR